ncbi:hypothetical protein [Vibrio rotiferianus]|uniref:hypothetical protein n=1 Tax=Vibrio rotiferianus TaxID=190895 RepID=UPI00406A65BB
MLSAEYREFESVQATFERMVKLSAFLKLGVGWRAHSFKGPNGRVVHHQFQLAIVAH